MVLRPEIDGLLDLYDREELNSSWGAWALGHVGCGSCSRQTLQHELGSCGTWTQLPCGMWNLPGPVIEFILPYIDKWIPNPWTIREVLRMDFWWKTEGYHKLMEMLTSIMVAVTRAVSLWDNTILNTCHTIIKRSNAYFWIPISEQHQRELAFLWLLLGTTALALGHNLILRDLQHLSSLQHLLVCY